MKKLYSILVCIFCALLAVPPVVSPLVASRISVPIDEKRQPAPFPEFSDRFGADMDCYLMDRAPFRDLIIYLYNNATASFEKDYLEYVLKVRTEIEAEKFAQEQEKIRAKQEEQQRQGQEAENEQVPIVNPLDEYFNGNDPILTDPFIDEREYYPFSVLSERVVQGRNGWYFYYLENSISYYEGTNLMNKADMQSLISKINEADALLKSKGKKLIIQFCPNKSTIYYDQMPSLTVSTTYRKVDRIVDCIRFNTDVKVAYPKDDLLKAKGNYQVYFKQDTHWNKLGAYLGAMSILDAMGQEVTPLKSSNVTVYKEVGGDLADFMGVAGNDDVDYNISYKPNISLTKTDLGIEDTDLFTSTNANGHKLFLAGDSFRKAQKDYLAKDFEQAFFTHRKNINNKKILPYLEEADYVVLQFVERYDGELYALLDSIVTALS